MRIFYDVEVLRGPDEVEGGWENPEAMGFGSAVAYLEQGDLYCFYGPDDLPSLRKLLWQSTELVTFNGVRFDNRVVFGNVKVQETKDTDLLIHVVRSRFGVNTVDEAVRDYGQAIVHGGNYGLSGLARGTLGRDKTGASAHAPELIRTGQWAALYAYNLNDVRLLRDLWAFGRKHGYLLSAIHERISVSL